MPIGTSTAIAMPIRVARENGMAHEMSGVTTPMTSTPTAAISSERDGRPPPERLVADPPAQAAPAPVPSSSENSVTVSE